MRIGITHQRQSGHPYANRRDRSYSEPIDDLSAEKAGYHCASGYDHGKNSRIVQRNGQVLKHRGPPGSQQGIGKAEADKSQVDDEE